MKYTAILAFAVALVSASAYFWFTYHAGELVRALILRESNGTVDIRIGRVAFDFRGHRLTLTNNRFVTPDTESLHYSLFAKRITLVVGPWRRVLLEGNVDLDTVLCESPSLEITRIKPAARNGLSIPEEVSRVYRILGKAVGNLRVRQFDITDGSLTLIKGYDSNSSPVVVTRIQLTIDDIRPDETPNASRRFLHSERIRVTTEHQEIQLPDTRRGIRFAQFQLDSRERRISADSVSFFGKRLTGAVDEFKIDFERLDILGADFRGLALNDVIRADSAVCTRPQVELNLRLGTRTQPRNEASKRALEQSFSQLVGSLDIGRIGIQDASAIVKADRNGHQSRYTTTHSDITLRQVRSLPSQPLHIGGFDIHIRDYLGYSADSLYAIQFDSIRLRDNILALGNFSIRATPRNRDAEWRDVRMSALELEEVYWPELVYRERLVAEAARMVNPSVDITLPSISRTRRKGSLYEALKGFRQKLEMRRLQLRDADVTIRAGNGSALRMTGFNSEIDVGRFLASGDATDLIGSVRGFSFDKGNLSNSTEQIQLEKGRYDGQSQDLALAKATYGNQREPLQISASGMVITGAERTPDNQFKASDVSWKRAEIFMDRDARPKREASGQKPLLIGWNSTHGLNSSLSIESGNLRITTLIDSLQTGSVLVPTQGKPRINGLELNGGSLLVESGQSLALATKYHVTDEKPSLFSNVRLQLLIGRNLWQAQLPSFRMTPDLESFLDNKPSITSVVLESPRFGHQRADTLKQIQAAGRMPSFTIGDLRIEDGVWTGPELAFHKKGLLSFTSADFALIGIRSNSQALSISRLEAGLSQPLWKAPQSIISVSSKEPARVSLTDISLSVGTGIREHKAYLESIRMPILELKPSPGMERPQSAWLKADSAEIRGLRLHNGMPNDPAGVLRENPTLEVKATRIHWNNNLYRSTVTGMHYVHRLRELQATSVSWEHAVDRQTFTRQSNFQKDHVRLLTEKVTARGLDPAIWFTDSLIQAASLDIMHPTLSVFRDRTLPRKPGIKPLPADFAASLPLQVDTLRYVNGDIDYEELRQPEAAPVHILTRQTNITVANIRSHRIQGPDSLQIDIQARLQDTARIRIRYRESYSDSLHGFHLAMRCGPFGLPALNTILEPMAAARIRRGNIDTITMKGAGNDSTARSMMRMRYRDLSIRFINPGDVDKKTLRTRLKNLLANTLLRSVSIRSAAAVQTDRDRQRGFLNHWVRMAFHGFLTNAGIRLRTLQEIRKGRHRQHPSNADVADILSQ